MARLDRITHRFVDRPPSPLEEGVVYVSIEFRTVIHKCCCGCGDKVVTPLTPVDWALVYDGQSVSLYPSIGRWDAPCRSHYWVRNDRVVWSDPWSKGRVDSLKQRETGLRDQYFGAGQDRGPEAGGSAEAEPGPRRRGWFGWVGSLYRRLRRRP
jgi:hypothetical protein